MAGKKAFPLRISEDIFLALRRWSDDELRSVNGQIEYVLRDALRKAHPDSDVHVATLGDEVRVR